MMIATLPVDNSSQSQPEGDDCSGARSSDGTPGRCQWAQGTENRRMTFLNQQRLGMCLLFFALNCMLFTSREAAWSRETVEPGCCC